MSRKIIIPILIYFASIIVDSSSFAQPNINSVNGSLTHNQTIVVSGVGFSTKSPAAPLVWDDCETGTITNKFIVRPNSGSADFNMQYRTTPFRNVTPPHTHNNTKFAGGGHDPAGYNPWDYNKGPNVFLAKNVSSPQVTYICFYHRVDPLWPTQNDNWKDLDFSSGAIPYSGSQWYAGPSPYNPPRFCYTGAGIGAGSYLHYYDATHTCSYLCCSCVYSCANWCMYLDADWKTWKHWEHVTNHTASGFTWSKLDNEFIYRSINARITNFNVGTMSVGGYWRKSLSGSQDVGDANAFRYYDDIYMDTTFSRVMLANNSNYDNATIIEPQIPSAWSDTSITCTVNLGKFQDQSTAYLFVFDSNNNRNATGYQITIGGSQGDSTPPSPPSGLRIIE